MVNRPRTRVGCDVFLRFELDEPVVLLKHVPKGIFFSRGVEVAHGRRFPNGPRHWF